MKQKEYFGLKSINNLESILKNEKSKNIFLITGKKSFELCGAQNKLYEIFKKTSCDSTRFYDFSSNPKLEEIQKGHDLFIQRAYDCIIGIGGGSTIDVAKSIKLFYHEKENKEVPLIAIPTTIGSGSEVTYFIVYYIGKEKQSKGNPKITLPNYFICDPELTMSLPKKIAASTGMDALCQALESYSSIYSTEESEKFAEQSMKISFENLEQAVNNPSIGSRKNMLKAANLAGKAINITKTTACHSISYPLTSYFNIPHGHAVSLTLGEMLIFNSQVNKEDCNDPRGVKYVKEKSKEIVKVFKVEHVKEVCHEINNLMKTIGLETKLSNLGISREDIALIIKNGFASERIKNNPRSLKKGNLRKILENIM